MTCATGRLGLNLQACLMPLRLEVFFFLFLSNVLKVAASSCWWNVKVVRRRITYLGTTCINLYIGFYKVLKKSYCIGIFRVFMLDSSAAALQSSVCETIFTFLEKKKKRYLLPLSYRILTNRYIFRPAGFRGRGVK